MYSHQTGMVLVNVIVLVFIVSLLTLSLFLTLILEARMHQYTVMNHQRFQIAEAILQEAIQAIPENAISWTPDLNQPDLLPANAWNQLGYIAKQCLKDFNCFYAIEAFFHDPCTQLTNASLTNASQSGVQFYRITANVVGITETNATTTILQIFYAVPDKRGVCHAVEKMRILSNRLQSWRVVS